MKKYQSKKNPEIIATLESVEEKYGTVILVYETGSDAGKSISITQSTFKRWWKLLTEESSLSESSLDIDVKQVNTPYPEPVKQKYIPKPQSVIDYEAKQVKQYNNDLPSFEELVAEIGSICTKVNDTSRYVKLACKTTLWRKSNYIDIYACETTAEKLIAKGLQCSGNKDKDRPFAFRVKTKADYTLVLEALLNE